MKSDKSSSAGGSSKSNLELQMLRFKLQSKTFARQLKEAKKAHAAGGEAKSVAASSSRPAAGASLGAGFTFNLSLGDFREAKLSITAKAEENREAAAALLAQLNAPDDTSGLFFIDFALRGDADEGKLGELVGILDSAINSVPWAEFPIPVYNSHNVDVIDAPDGSKLLRIAFFSSLDPNEILAMFNVPGALEKSDERMMDPHKFDFKFELPFSLSDFQDPEFKLTPDKITARLTSSVKLDSSILQQAEGVIETLPKKLRNAMQARLALAQFMRASDVTFKFASLAELLEKVPGE